MNITSFNSERIKKGVQKAREQLGEPDQNVKILFSPFEINEENFEETCRIYSRLNKSDYNTVVIVESHPGSAAKKLPMPSFKKVETSLGEVFANDTLRNDFADEDDDFFVNDDAFDNDVSLYNQLMLLQTVLDDFTVLSMQITDENSFIVKELAFAIEEILASRNALVIFCCDLAANHREEMQRIVSLVDSNNKTGLMNYLNSGESNINGAGSFAAGLLVAQKWGLHIHFPCMENSDDDCKNLAGGYGVMQKQPIFG